MNKKFYHWFVVSLVLMVLANLTFFSTAHAYSNQNGIKQNKIKTASVTNTSLSDMEQIINQFVTRDDDTGVHFDMDAAIKANASADVLAVGEEINYISQNNKNLENTIAEQNATSNTSTVQNRSISLPIWGNWCGPGHGGGTPKDKLDSLCKSHDLCYGKKGYFACSCDKNLINGINRYFGSMKIKERIAALAVKTYFSNAPCNPFK
ncbi:hypothetical protein [Macrococcus carouselicus]|uniref:Phospholipase A2 domain-containing protein n=1 Tax=Macrococcus carouselicus TaxID=69969 RepID=A0A9Q8CM33_9STAP|nr:hypothetical protein [Macrococcus carouselicus]TDM02423.1 hypothetical protein ERX40_07665 [Macrococcus carouselicus]